MTTINKIIIILALIVSLNLLNAAKELLIVSGQVRCDNIVIGNTLVERIKLELYIFSKSLYIIFLPKL